MMPGVIPNGRRPPPGAILIERQSLAGTIGICHNRAVRLRLRCVIADGRSDSEIRGIFEQRKEHD
jgi:hypothetical protein